MIRIILYIILFWCNLTYAYDAKITINGNVTALPCHVDSNNYEIDLGDLYISDFKRPNSHSEWHYFSMTLSNCPDIMSRVKATYRGSPSSDDIRFYKNDGSSSNILIELQRVSDSTILGNNTEIYESINGAHAAAFGLRVRATTLKGDVTKGDISSNITVTYTYE